MTMTTTLNVGDAVLYMKKHGARPVAGNVYKVTKTWARVTLADGNEVGPFKREAFDGEHAAIKSSSWRTYSAVWAKTDERETELNASADRSEEEAAEKKADAVARQEAYNQRITAELDEVKVAIGHHVPGGSFHPDTMPDGSRIYMIDLPVKTQYSERKKGWEWVIVRCWNEEDYDWSASRETGEDVKITVVKSSYTYCNGGSSSFSSASTSNHSSDEDAVWDAVRSCYHSW